MEKSCVLNEYVHCLLPGFQMRGQCATQPSERKQYTVKMQHKVEECPQLGMRTEVYTTDAIRYEEIYDTEADRQVSGKCPK